MKKIRVKRKSPARSQVGSDHNSRRLTFGIALILLGVLTVLNLIYMFRSENVVPVQGADVYQSQQH